MRHVAIYPKLRHVVYITVMFKPIRKTIMIKKTILPLLFVASLIGCAPPAYVIDDTKSIGSLGSKTTIIIEDMRPESDKTRSIGSLLVTSDDYGIWTIGDKQFEPPIIDILKKTIAKTTSEQKNQPKSIKINLKRLIIQANHQADLLQSVSSTQTPLSVAIAEAMHGKEFEKDINKTKPYIIGFIDSTVTTEYEGRKAHSRKLLLSKAENFRSHVDEEGRKKASINVVKALMREVSTAIYSQ